MSVLKDMLKSKKFWYMIVGGIVAIVGNFKPEWADVVQQMLYGIVALILGQGFSDMGKEAKKLDK